MTDLSEAAQAYLASVKTPIRQDEILCTVNGRFVHRMRKGSDNTACGALPSKVWWDRQEKLDKERGLPFYGGNSPVQIVSSSDSLKMHVCGKCWPR